MLNRVVNNLGPETFKDYRFAAQVASLMSKSGTKLPSLFEYLGSTTTNKNFLVPRDVSFSSLPNGASDLDSIASALATLTRDANRWSSSEKELKTVLNDL